MAEKLPTPEEQMETYRQRKRAYDAAITQWIKDGRPEGKLPPRPVRPHTPGWKIS